MIKSCFFLLLRILLNNRFIGANLHFYSYFWVGIVIFSQIILLFETFIAVVLGIDHHR